MVTATGKRSPSRVTCTALPRQWDVSRTAARATSPSSGGDHSL